MITFYKIEGRDVKNPTRGTSESAGIDFYIPKNFESFSATYAVTVYNSNIVAINPGGSINIPCGFRVKLPIGYCLNLINKSGIALNKNLIIGACLIDEDYQGEMHLHVINIGNKSSIIESGQKLVQGKLEKSNIVPFKVEDDYFGAFEKKSERIGGFGSTGLE